MFMVDINFQLVHICIIILHHIAGVCNTYHYYSTQCFHHSVFSSGVQDGLHTIAKDIRHWCTLLVFVGKTERSQHVEYHFFRHTIKDSFGYLPYFC